MRHSVHRRHTATLAAALVGVTTLLSGTVATAAAATTRGAPVATTASSAGAGNDWFVDPRTPSERRSAIAVPRDPKRYDGKVRETHAIYRTHAGDLAVPVRHAFGHAIEKEQAVTLSRKNLFAADTDRFTAHARRQLGLLALPDISSIRCEGYTDYAGAAKRNRTLSRGRAAAVCSALAVQNGIEHTTVVGYGPTHPAVVGGESRDRRLNTRVVVQATGVRPPVPSLPGAPTLKAVHGERGSLVFSFVAPVDDGASPITGYEVNVGDGWVAVQPEPSNGRAAAALPESSADRLVGALSGLVPGQRTLRVRAVNAVGAGLPSNSLEATVFDVPSAPTGLTVAGDDGALTTSFGIPGNDGGSPVSAFEVSYDGGGTWEPATIQGDAPWTVRREGFANGTTYDVRVRASNQWGDGPAATAEALVATTPGEPTGVRATADGATVTISFAAPAFDGGIPVTGYQVRTDNGDWVPVTLVGDGTSFLLADQPVGSHTYQVRAVNDRGVSQASDTTTVEVAAVEPDAPRITYFGYNGPLASWVVYFQAGPDNGATVTGWEVSVDGGPWIRDSAVGTANGQTANFPCSNGACGWDYSTPIRLRAVTATGWSQPSQPFVHYLP